MHYYWTSLVSLKFHKKKCSLIKGFVLLTLKFFFSFFALAAPGLHCFPWAFSSCSTLGFFLWSFSYCGAQALELGAQLLHSNVESSRMRDQTHVPCNGRGILSHQGNPCFINFYVRPFLYLQTYCLNDF